jgi:starch phosphorylase
MRRYQMCREDYTINSMLYSSTYGLLVFIIDLKQLMNCIISKYGTADISLLKQKLQEMRILDNVDLPASIAKLFVKPKEKKESAAESDGKLLLESLDSIAEVEEKIEPGEEDSILSETMEKNAESEDVADSEKEDSEDELDPFVKYDPNLSRVVRMANLSVVGGHSVNGVAEIHSEIVKQDVFNSFYEVFARGFGNCNIIFCSSDMVFHPLPFVAFFRRCGLLNSKIKQME